MNFRLCTFDLNKVIKKLSFPYLKPSTGSPFHLEFTRLLMVTCKILSHGLWLPLLLPLLPSSPTSHHLHLTSLWTCLPCSCLKALPMLLALPTLLFSIIFWVMPLCILVFPLWPMLLPITNLQLYFLSYCFYSTSHSLKITIWYCSLYSKTNSVREENLFVITSEEQHRHAVGINKCPLNVDCPVPAQFMLPSLSRKN